MRGTISYNRGSLADVIGAKTVTQTLEGTKRHVQFVIRHFIQLKETKETVYYNVRQIMKKLSVEMYFPSVRFLMYASWQADLSSRSAGIW